MITLKLTITQEDFDQLEALANADGIGVDTLVHRWIEREAVEQGSRAQRKKKKPAVAEADATPELAASYLAGPVE